MSAVGQGHAENGVDAVVVWSPESYGCDGLLRAGIVDCAPRQPDVVGDGARPMPRNSGDVSLELREPPIGQLPAHAHVLNNLGPVGVAEGHAAADILRTRLRRRVQQ